MVSQAAMPAVWVRQPFRRRADRRPVAGVAGGIADRLNASVSFVRFLLVLASVVAPWVIWVYAAAALLIPAEGHKRPDWDNLIGVGRVAVLFGVPVPEIPGGALDISQPIGGSLGWWIASLGLTGAGATALMSADYRRGRPRSLAEARSTVLATLPVAGCAALLAGGVLVAAELRWERLVPVVVLVGGVALAIAPRRRDFVAPAIVALGVCVLIVAAESRLEGGVGHLRLTPTVAAGNEIVARRAVGSVTVDLRRLPRSLEPITFTASVGMGRLRVIVPRGARVEIHARVGRGHIDPALLRDRPELQGFDQRLVRTHGGKAGALRVRLVADVGLGTIEIDGPNVFRYGRGGP